MERDCRCNTKRTCWANMMNRVTAKVLPSEDQCYRDMDGIESQSSWMFTIALTFLVVYFGYIYYVHIIPKILSKMEGES